MQQVSIENSLVKLKFMIIPEREVMGYVWEML